MRPLRILTWHVHGSYLYYLTQSGHEFYLPVTAERGEGYGGRTPSFEWPDNVHEIAADDVRRQEFDCIIFQSRRNWVSMLAEQRKVPSAAWDKQPTPRSAPPRTLP